MNPLIQLKNATPVFLVGLVLACFALPQRVQATDLGSVLPGGNTADGFGVLTSLTTGGYNTGTGWFSLKTVSSGSFNTAFGAATLFSNTGDRNTAVGAAALLSNTTGGFNTANGAFALLSNTTGFDNVANGAGALESNSTGSLNTAVGATALVRNTTGNNNTATGASALFFNTTGNDNTATGYLALNSNTTGDDNTANGVNALQSNTNGSHNTATGYQALNGNTGGGQNTANGVNALQSNTNGAANTAIGFQALENNTTGNLNIALGFNAGSNLTSGDNNIYIGSLGVATESDTIRIGTSGVQTSAFIRGIRGVTTGNNDAVPVLIDSAGQLGTTSSSRRFKKEIKPMDSASEAILSLKPVTFHYKSDSKDTPQFGLIAEEVAAVNPDLVVHDENGEIYTVRYDAVNAMLLNEFLKEHRAFCEERHKVERMEKQIEALTAGLQKVSAQLELNKTVPQTVLNNR
jgi:trimeric autotransporter adhesin